MLSHMKYLLSSTIPTLRIRFLRISPEIKTRRQISKIPWDRVQGNGYSYIPPGYRFLDYFKPSLLDYNTFFLCSGLVVGRYKQECTILTKQNCLSIVAGGISPPLYLYSTIAYNPSIYCDHLSSASLNKMPRGPRMEETFINLIEEDFYSYARLTMRYRMHSQHT